MPLLRGRSGGLSKGGYYDTQTNRMGAYGPDAFDLCHLRRRIGMVGFWMTDPNRYVMICRLDTRQEWDRISNPKPSDFTKAHIFLTNDFNEYVEWKNCGVVYRFVRREDLAKYEQA